MGSLAYDSFIAFFPVYAAKPEFARWNSEDTVFAIFDGINDIQISYYQGVPATTVLNAKIFAVYHGLVDMLYYSGARNFAFLNVPPVDRAPLVVDRGVSDQVAVEADIKAWNNALTAMARDIKKEKPDVNIFVVDAHRTFTKVMDDPQSYKQTALYKNTTVHCEAYSE